MAIVILKDKRFLTIFCLVAMILISLNFVLSQGEYRVYYLSNILIDPPLDEDSIEREAPYIFNISSSSIDKYFNFFEEGLLEHRISTNKKNSYIIRVKIVRRSDDNEFYLRHDDNCSFSISNGEKQICDEKLYKSIEKDIDRLIHERSINKYWLWRLREG